VVFQTSSFKESLGSAIDSGVAGVEVSDTVSDPRPFDRRYEPGHPDADKEGYVSYPNVNVMEEMANMVEASRSYEANISAIGIVKAMINKTLEIGK
jgi:flagellar basal-body rod protein FlgC